jgi:hypothetical protein
VQGEDDPHVVAFAPQLSRQRPGDIRQAAYFYQRSRFGGEKKDFQWFRIWTAHRCSPG